MSTNMEIKMFKVVYLDFMTGKLCCRVGMGNCLKSSRETNTEVLKMVRKSRTQAEQVSNNRNKLH